jgi:hypothetical protein
MAERKRDKQADPPGTPIPTDALLVDALPESPAPTVVEFVEPEDQPEVGSVVESGPSFQEQMALIIPNPLPLQFAMVNGEVYVWHPGVQKWAQPALSFPG